MRTLLAALLVLAAAPGLSAARAEDPPPPAAPAPAPAPASADAPDVLVLRDGRRLEGRVLAESPEAVTFRSGGTTRLYERTLVDRVERAPAAPAGASGGTPPSAAPGEAAPAKAKPKKARKAAAPRPVTELGPEARRWIDELALRAVVEDEEVRRSVAAALRALGPAAGPAVREAAATAATASAREFLARIGDELGATAARKESGTAKPGAEDAPSTGGATPPPRAAEPGPAGPGRAAARGRARGAAETLLAELELREDQRPKMAGLLGTLEGRQARLVRDARTGTLDAAGAANEVEAIRRETLDAAKSVLDAAQWDLFEERVGRYLDALLVRLSRAPGRSPESPAAPAPPPSGPGTPPAK